MDINESADRNVRNLLNELKKPTYKYGCLMLNFNVTKTWWEQIQKNILDVDIVRVDGANGREKYRDAHVTLLYGFHKNIDVEDVKEIALEQPVRNIIASKVSYFSSSKFDVVKFEFEYSFLTLMNRNLKRLRHTSSFPTYNAHMTIAYVRKGMGQHYCDLINKKYTRTLRPTEFVFSKYDGTKTKFDIDKKI